jgi:hypothetical protein
LVWYWRFGLTSDRTVMKRTEHAVNATPTREDTIGCLSRGVQENAAREREEEERSGCDDQLLFASSDVGACVAWWRSDASRLIRRKAPLPG